MERHTSSTCCGCKYKPRAPCECARLTLLLHSKLGHGSPYRVQAGTTYATGHIGRERRTFSFHFRVLTGGSAAACDRLSSRLLNLC